MSAVTRQTGASHPGPGNPLATAARAVNDRLGVVGLGLIVALVVEIVAFSIASPYFLDGDNFANIGRAMTIVGIAAIGQTVVIVAGGFDLSVGSVMAAAGMLAAWLVNDGVTLPLALLAALAGGVLVGVVNGAIAGYLRINPLITTLATLAIVRGLAFVISGGEADVVSDAGFLSIGTDSVAGVPVVVILLVALFLAVGFLLPRTRFGRYAYAVGSNARAARLAGVPVNRWRLVFYGLSGSLAAVAGCVTVARTGQAEPAANMGAELDVITAVILGGTSLNGGRGRLLGTFLGLAVLAVLNNGMILVGVESYWQQVVKGAVLLVAVAWDQLRRGGREDD